MPINRRAFCALSAMPFVTGCQRKYPFDRLSNTQQIIALGDNYTFGVGITQSLGYPAILERLSGIPVINAGILNGGVEDLFPTIVKTDLESTGLVVLVSGANNFMRQEDPKIIEKNLSKTVEYITNHGIPLIVVGMGVPGSNKVHPLYQKVATQYSALYCHDVFMNMFANKENLVDEYRWSTLGYYNFANNMYHWMIPYGFVSD